MIAYVGIILYEHFSLTQMLALFKLTFFCREQNFFLRLQLNVRVNLADNTNISQCGFDHSNRGSRNFHIINIALGHPVRFL